MILANLVEMLTGPRGTIEVTRVAFATGSLGMVIGPLVFQSYALLHGQTWDPAAFCAGYGGGLAAILGGGGLGIGAKDKATAVARATGANNPEQGDK